jgi:hypothetical protein
MIINNFANASHVKEVMDKTNVLEQRVLGAPKPHRSWRDLVLVVILSSLSLGLLLFVLKRYVFPRFLKQLVSKVNAIDPSVQSISEQVSRDEKKVFLSNNGTNITIQQLLQEQNEKVSALLNKLEQNPNTTALVPIRI